jgi:transposase
MRQGKDAIAVRRAEIILASAQGDSAPEIAERLHFTPDYVRKVIHAFNEQGLDAHRKRQQSLHPDLTLTNMYNVLEKLRAGEPLSKKDKTIHEQGLVSVLKQIHDDLDAAVFEAYGWPATFTDEEILERLVALNAERAAEEKRGLIRWLRPEFQAPKPTAKSRAASSKQQELVPSNPRPSTLDSQIPTLGSRPSKTQWPKTLTEQVQAIRTLIRTHGAATNPDALAKHFKGARKDKIAEILDALKTLGQVRQSNEQ